MSEVRLIGGPFDGDVRDINPACMLFTLDWEEETVERDWDGHTVYATKIGLAAYQRVDAATFRHCRVPSTVGDTNLQLPERQLRLDEEDI